MLSSMFFQGETLAERVRTNTVSRCSSLVFGFKMTFLYLVLKKNVQKVLFLFSSDEK